MGEAKSQSYETQNQKEVGWFHHANDLTEAFYRWIKANTNVEVEIYYTISFFQFLKLSKEGVASIKLKKSKFENNSISFNSMLYETKKPYRFCLWRYQKGKHYNRDLENVSDYSPNDFPTLWNKACDFFEIATEKQERWVQMSIFDFMEEVG